MTRRNREQELDAFGLGPSPFIGFMDDESITFLQDSFRNAFRQNTKPSYPSYSLAIADAWTFFGAHPEWYKPSYLTCALKPTSL
jgi:hypothetical protein